jgi:hypothetical protein
MKNTENRKAAEHDTKPNSSPTRSNLPSPKRGAFPTPKAEIESATPYIPDPDQTDSHQPTESDLPTNDDVGGNEPPKPQSS